MPVDTIHLFVYNNPFLSGTTPFWGIATVRGRSMQPTLNEKYISEVVFIKRMVNLHVKSIKSGDIVILR